MSLKTVIKNKVARTLFVFNIDNIHYVLLPFTVLIFIKEANNKEAK